MKREEPANSHTLYFLSLKEHCVASAQKVVSNYFEKVTSRGETTTCLSSSAESWHTILLNATWMNAVCRIIVDLHKVNTVSLRKQQQIGANSEVIKIFRKKSPLTGLLPFNQAFSERNKRGEFPAFWTNRKKLLTIPFITLVTRNYNAETKLSFKKNGKDIPPLFRQFGTSPFINTAKNFPGVILNSLKIMAKAHPKTETSTCVLRETLSVFLKLQFFLWETATNFYKKSNF